MHDSINDFIENFKYRLMDEKIKLGMNDAKILLDNDTICRDSDIHENQNNDEYDDQDTSFRTEAVTNSTTKPDDPENQENCPAFTQVDESQKLPMLRRGEYSPTHRALRIASQPYLGFGEYESRRQKFVQERQADLKEYLEKQKRNAQQKVNKKIQKKKLPKLENNGTYGKTSKYITRNLFLDTTSKSTGVNKSVQTDLQGVENQLVQYNYEKAYTAEKELLPKQNVDNDESDIDGVMADRSRANQLAVKIDKVQIGTQNNIIVPGQDRVPSSALRDNSPRARLMADLKHTYYPSFYDDEKPNDDLELIKMNKLKWERARQREEYQEDLRKQIEEKQRQTLEAVERERREEEALTRRLEKQLQQLKAERERDEARRIAREHKLRLNSEEFLRKQKEYQSDIEREKRKVVYNRTIGIDSQMINRSEPSTINRRSQLPFYNSPPIPSHRPKVPFSFNIPHTSVFANPTPATSYDHHFTKRSDKLNEINKVQTDEYRVSSRNSLVDQIKQRTVEDSLPIPVLRAKSPVAESLKYSSVVDSHAPPNSAMRQVEGKWKIPAVQKNIVTRTNSIVDGRNKNVLTQLGAIRLQLQQEQMRMDQTLQQKVASNTTRPNVKHL